MKKLFSISMIMLIASIIFCSCSSSKHMSHSNKKRHNVSHSKGNSNIGSNNGTVFAKNSCKGKK